MKTKLLFLTLVLLAIGGSLFGQTLTPAASSTGSITVNAANCNTTNACIILHMASSNVGYSVTVSGTWTGTLTVEQSGDNQGSWTSTTTTTANTLFTSALLPGITDARVRGSAAMTGTAVVTITASGPATLQQITQTGGNSSASTFSGVIDTTSSKYLTPIGHTIPDATFTSGVATIDCTFSNDCNFVAGTDNGSVCFGTNFTTDVSILNPTSAVLPEGTLTVTGAQTATCSGGNSTATTVHNGTFVWGKLGHTQLNSAYTDCMAQNGCDYQLPAGPVLVESAVGVTDCIKCSEGVGYGRIQVRGWGQTISQLIPTPNLPAASCIGGPSTDLNGCFFSGSSIQSSDYGIFGAGQANIGAGFNGKVGMISQGGGGTGGFANVYNNSLLLLAWGATTTGFTGWRGEAMSGMTHHDVHLDGFGLIGCDINNTQVPNFLATFEGSYCAVTGGTSLQVRSGWLTSHGGFYGWINTAVPAVTCLGTGVICSFFGDTAPYQTGTGGAQFEPQTGATMYLDGVIVTNSTASSFGVGTFGTGILHMRNSTVTVNGTTGTGLISQASGNTYLEGGNVINAGGSGVAINRAGGNVFYSGQDQAYTGTLTGVLPTCAMTSGGGTGPACATVAGSTNEKGTIRMTPGTTPGATGTTTLTFQGTFAGPTSTTPACNFNYANSGTGAWSLTTTTPILMTTRSNTAPVFNWNQTGALTAASTYDIDYVCVPR